MQTIRPIASIKFEISSLNSSTSSTAEQSPMSFTNDNFYFNRQNGNYQLPERLFSPSPSQFQINSFQSNDSSFTSFNSFDFENELNSNMICYSQFESESSNSLVIKIIMKMKVILA